MRARVLGRGVLDLVAKDRLNGLDEAKLKDSQCFT